MGSGGNNKIDPSKYIGRKYNSLTVIDGAGIKNKKSYLLCQCDCGTIKEISYMDIVSGKTTSCGCKNRLDASKYIGQKYGYLTIIKEVENKKQIGTIVLCRCECGKEKEFQLTKVINGNNKTCGCGYKEPKDISEYIGKKYNRLTILSYEGQSQDKEKRTLVKCKCDCGNIIVRKLKDVKRGNVKSCGCLYKESRHVVSYKDGRTSERLYNIYNNMISRCLNVNNAEYKDYGGRGITVCEEWLSDYSIFRKWAYDNGYDENLTREECSIDRIDNDKGYYPDNCRWTNWITQQNNKRTNCYITFEGETHTLAEWARIKNLNYQMISNRYKRGYPIDILFFDGNIRDLKKE